MESNKLSIYGEEVVFPDGVDISELQDKLDLLVATARLLGYKIKVGKSSGELTSSIVKFDFMKNEKMFYIEFLYIQGKFMIGIADNVLDFYYLSSMEKILKRLDEILVYI